MVWGSICFMSMGTLLIHRWVSSSCRCKRSSRLRILNSDVVVVTCGTHFAMRRKAPGKISFCSMISKSSSTNRRNPLGLRSKPLWIRRHCSWTVTRSSGRSSTVITPAMSSWKVLSAVAMRRSFSSSESTGSRHDAAVPSRVNTTVLCQVSVPLDGSRLLDLCEGVCPDVDVLGDNEGWGLGRRAIIATWSSSSSGCLLCAFPPLSSHCSM